MRTFLLMMQKFLHHSHEEMLKVTFPANILRFFRAFNSKIDVNTTRFTRQIMESRKQPSRKAREEALVRKDEEVAMKIAKKRQTPDVEEIAGKKRDRKAKSEDTESSEASTSKKGAKAAPKAKSETPSTAAKANGDSKKAASSKTKESGKSKTDDDIKPPAKDSKSKTKEARRSRSAEPMTTSNGAKKKNSKKDDAIAEEPVPAKKGGRGKKAAEPEEQVEEAPKANGRGKRASPTPDDEAPPVKKGRGKKAPPVVADDEEEEEEVEAPEEKPAKGEKKLLNNVNTNYENIDFGIKEKFNFKITSWNVGGLRALMKKNPDYFTQEDADIVCMNVSFYLNNSLVMKFT
jgi:hypothetical protein